MGKKATQEENQEVDPLLPPPELDKEEKWIVRVHGKDMGPFSNSALYPKLLLGEIEPESLLLDENTFTRLRLQEVEELQPYLHLHNTQNPILLEEEKRKEKDRQWEETGRKRAILITSSIVTVLIAGIVAYFYFRKGGDVYLSEDGDFQLSLNSKLGALKEVKTSDAWKKFEGSGRKRRRGKGKGKKKGSSDSGGPIKAIDMSTGGGGIPKAKVERIVHRNIRRIFPCITRQKSRDSRFTGADIKFTIAGVKGRVTYVDTQNTDFSSPILKRCIKRVSRRWRFPRFSGNAIIVFPVYIERRTRW